MTHKLTAFARKLRRDSTDAERLFWSKVRAYRLQGHKFKRQQILGPYIVDFLCPNAFLVVELDGRQHADSESDKIRDAWLRSRGFTVLRFWNNDVLLNIDGVLERVIEHLPLPSTSLPLPSPSPMERGSETNTSPLERSREAREREMNPDD